MHQPSSDFSFNNEDKRATQDCVRDNAYSELIARNHSATWQLLVLHKLATHNTQRQKQLKTYDPYYETLLRSSYRSQYRLHELKQLAREIRDKKHGTMKIRVAAAHGQGRFRLLGTIIENYETENPIEEQVYEHRATSIHLSRGEGFYVAPSIGVDDLMELLGSVFDIFKTEVIEDPEEKLIQTIILNMFFYTTGCLFIHPFIGGNHRAFDRFLELEFLKAGYRITLPQDETSNIPPTEKIRNYMAMLHVNFMRISGLPFNFNATTEAEHMQYQAHLVEAIKEFIVTGIEDEVYQLFLYLMTQEVVKWIDLSDTGINRESIDQIIEEKLTYIKTKVQVIHRNGSL